VVGGGSSLKWIMYIDGQQSTAPTTSYGVPVLTSLSGSGAVASSTHGYGIVTIAGDYFSDQSHLQSVKYGPTGVEFLARDCRLTINHTQIECYTVAGEGTNQMWVVTVAGQSNLPSSAFTTDFEGPSSLSLDPDIGPTNGGTTVYLTGHNFGRIFSEPDAKAAKLFIGNDPSFVELPYTALIGIDPAPPAVAMGQPLPEFSSVRNKDELRFNLPAGHGYRDMYVEIDGQKSPTVRFEYNAPNITNVVIQQQDTGDIAVLDMVLIGSNFGTQADGKVFVAESEALLTGATFENYRVHDNNVTSWTHEKIILSFRPSNSLSSVPSGYVQIHLGNGDMLKKSSPPDESPTRFNNFNPFILSQDLIPDKFCQKDDSCQYYSYCPPAGVIGETECEDLLLSNPIKSKKAYKYRSKAANTEGGGLLKLWGKFFGTDPSVRVGGLACPLVAAKYGRESIPPNASAAIAIENDLNYGDLTVVICRLPPGQGTNQEIIVSQGDQDSQPRGLDFSPPTVFWTEKKMAAPTQGGDRVTITGTNFGNSKALTSVIVGTDGIIGQTVGSADYNRDPSSHVMKLTNHENGSFMSSLEFVIPEGEGSHNITLIVAGQFNSANQLPFRYNLPSVSNFAMEKTNGAVAISVDGANFGAPHLHGTYLAFFDIPNIRFEMIEGCTSLSCDRHICSIVQDKIKPNSTKIISHTHTHIEMNCPMAVSEEVQGKEFVISVGGRVGMFTSPQVTNYTIQDGTDKETAQGAANTAGGTVIELRGQYFTDTPDITIAGKECVILEGTQKHDEDGSTMRCTVPPGEGKDQPLVLRSFFGEHTFPFQYLAPTVLSIRPAACATQGNTSITISGEDFGSGISDKHRVFIDGNICRVYHWNHSMVMCVAPEGQGKNITLAVDTSGQQGTRSYSYEPPVITGIIGFDSTPTEGAIVTISGSNLGRHGIVTLHPIGEGDGSPWAESTSIHSLSVEKNHGHTQIIMMMPSDPGYGGGRELILNISGNIFNYYHEFGNAGRRLEAEPGLAFRYTPPVVMAITNVPVPTIALLEPPALPQPAAAGERWKITLTGSSFGMPVLVPVMGINQTKTYESFPTAEVRIYKKTNDLNDRDSGNLIDSTRIAANTQCGLSNAQCNYRVCDVVSQSHQKIVCAAPEGWGSGVKVHVAIRPPNSKNSQGQWPSKDTTGGYELCSQNDVGFSISYAEPVIHSWLPYPVDANGEGVVTIIGENFGEVITTPSIKIGGMECTEAKWNDPWTDSTKTKLTKLAQKPTIGPRPFITCILPKVAVGVKNSSITGALTASALTARASLLLPSVLSLRFIL
jgi:hypothetical protein